MARCYGPQDAAHDRTRFHFLGFQNLIPGARQVCWLQVQVQDAQTNIVVAKDGINTVNASVVCGLVTGQWYRLHYFRFDCPEFKLAEWVRTTTGLTAACVNGTGFIGHDYGPCLVDEAIIALGCQTICTHSGESPSKSKTGNPLHQPPRTVPRRRFWSGVSN